MNVNDPAELSFRTPRQQRRRRQPSAWVWWVVTILSAIGFVFVIRALLERTAWTAGPAPQALTPSVAVRVSARPVSEIVEAPLPMVYRCVGSSGAVSLQSQPCGAGQRMTRAVPAPPDVEPVRQRSTARTSPSPAAAYDFTPSSTSDLKRAQGEARCAMARHEREQTLERIGLKRTYDLLQRLDAMVAQACNG